MALDPMIARGVQPIEVGNTLMRIGALKQRDESLAQDAQYQNALMQDRQADRAQQQSTLEQQQAQQERAKQAAYKYALIAKGDMGALQEAVAGIAQHHPAFVETFQRDPEQARAAILSGMQSEFGFAAPEKKPGPLEMQRMPDGTTFYLQDGVSRGMRTPPAPQQGPAPVNNQLITRPVGNGMVQDFAWNPRSNQMVPAGKPYKQEGKATVAQSAVDKSFAPEYAKFVTGGAADAQKALEELRTVHSQLKGGKKNLTGPVVGSVPLEKRAVFNQGSVDAEETVANTVQRSLRVILGAQFTQKEGEALIRRAYNPQLSEAKNAERVGRLVTQLERSLIAKQEAAKYYEQNGTLVGYQGKTDFSLSDFNVDGSAFAGTGGWSIEEVP